MEMLLPFESLKSGESYTYNWINRNLTFDEIDSTKTIDYINSVITVNAINSNITFNVVNSNITINLINLNTTSNVINSTITFNVRNSRITINSQNTANVFSVIGSRVTFTGRRSSIGNNVTNARNIFTIVNSTITIDVIRSRFTSYTDARCTRKVGYQCSGMARNPEFRWKKPLRKFLQNTNSALNLTNSQITLNRIKSSIICITMDSLTEGSWSQRSVSTQYRVLRWGSHLMKRLYSLIPELLCK